jgi:hypothetical protein
MQDDNLTEGDTTEMNLEDDVQEPVPLSEDEWE